MSVVCALLVVLGEDECREELNRMRKCAANVFTPWYTPIFFCVVNLHDEERSDPSVCCAPYTVLI